MANLPSTPRRDKFVLKGATLFTLWTGQTYRPTKDLGLLGHGSSDISEVEETIRAIRSRSICSGVFG